MPRNRSYAWPVVIVVLAALIVLIALPQKWRVWAPSFLQKPGLHLGLDLAGGTQLDFRISEDEIQSQLDDLNKQIAAKEKAGAPAEQLNELRAQKRSVEDQRTNLVEAIRNVLERRINALGVSEATITPSYVGNEKHLLVECPGVVDVQECIKVVGKTIQLEFKEQFTEATDEFRAGVRAQAAATARRITQSGSSVQKEGQDIGAKVGSYVDNRPLFRDQLPAGLEEAWTAKPGQLIQKDASVDCQNPQALSVEFIKQYCIDQQGQLASKKIPGIFLAEVVQPLTETGRIINEAPKAFTELSKTESGTTYAYKAAVQLDAKLDARIASALRDMQAGTLKTVAVDDTARLLFLRQFRPGGEQAEASHILVSYRGATAAEPGVTRTKQEALAKAIELKKQLTAGADFPALARRESDGPSRKDGGRLGAFGRGTMAPAFEDVAFKMKAGQISDPVETQFGYHLIRLDKAPATTPAEAEYDELKVTGRDAVARADALLARLQRGDVRSREPALGLRTLFFSLLPSGWKDTQLDGKHFRHAAVSLDPVSNVPVVQIAFDAEGARLFQELTKKNIGKPIAIFVGGELVSAPRVQAEISGGNAVITGSNNITEAQTLAQDLNTGAIPAPIHLAGQYTVEATLGSTALQSSLTAALLGLVILMIYMIVIYRGLGLVADAALMVFAIILFALLKLPVLLVTSNYVVLTLAGVAGILLSVGLAVDASVLIFERFKEEIRRGKSIKSAVEGSFTHAWPAIRDGNVSTLITCSILFLIGTSIVRGFAVTLSIGTVLTMCTAYFITRWMLRTIAASRFANLLDPYLGRGARGSETTPS